ncbi:MAG: hypothetical protein AB7V45_09795 [Candidatus Krumholzibacteriia bacterium]
MKRMGSGCGVLVCLFLLAGCQGDDSPMSVERQQKWNAKLAGYQAQVDQVKAEVEGVTDLREVFGEGSGEVAGDGTFIGDGVGTATLTGVGVVTGTVEGSFKVKGTRDVSVTGLVYQGKEAEYDRYAGFGYFTATSDVAQEIEVVVDGDCWVVGAGTGMVFWSGEGWAFWYH